MLCEKTFLKNSLLLPSYLSLLSLNTNSDKMQDIGFSNKRAIFYVRYSLSLMKTAGEITFWYFEPQISFPPCEGTFIIWFKTFFFLVNDKMHFLMSLTVLTTKTWKNRAIFHLFIELPCPNFPSILNFINSF